MTAPLLDIHIQDKHHGSRPVLAGIRLQVAQGDTLALVGASGCGKSSLLRIVSGLDRDYRGEVLLDGQTVRGPTPGIRLVFQEPRLFPWLTVAENIAFDATEPVTRSRPRVDALLEEVGLGGLGARLPKALSGGQAQRVAIARGLFTRPQVLLLDEPFSAVDAFTRLKLQELLGRVTQAHGITTLVVTHDIEEAVLLGSRVAVLRAAPGQVSQVVPVAASWPRDRASPGVAVAARSVRAALEAVHAL